MNLKEIRYLVKDIDLELLYLKIERSSIKKEIMDIFIKELGVEFTDQNQYIENFEYVKHEPCKFRQSVIIYINNVANKADYAKAFELGTIFK
jgi:hypothetical protein